MIVLMNGAVRLARKQSNFLVTILGPTLFSEITPAILQILLTACYPYHVHVLLSSHLYILFQRYVGNVHYCDRLLVICDTGSCRDAKVHG